MMRSARCSRSYGFTHGSIGAHADTGPSSAVTTSVTRAQARRRDGLLMALLHDQGPDAVHVPVLIARQVAVVHEAHDAIAIDDHRGGHRLHPIELTDPALRIVEDRIAHRSLLQPGIASCASGSTFTPRSVKPMSLYCL